MRACDCTHKLGRLGDTCENKEHHTLRKQKEFGASCSRDMDQIQRKLAATDLTPSLGRHSRSDNKIVTF